MIRSHVASTLATLSDAAEELFDWIDLTGPVDRRSFWLAVLLATGLVAIGYAMDWFVFGAIRLARPDFFACVIGGALILPLLTLGVRRLRDSGRSGWLMLLLIVPPVGVPWLMLWWSEPSGKMKERRDDRSKGRCPADRTDDSVPDVYQC